MRDTIIKRKSKDGFIFYNSNRTYRSKAYKTEDEREKAIDKYIEKQIEIEKQAEIRRKKEYDLTHE